MTFSMQLMIPVFCLFCVIFLSNKISCDCIGETCDNPDLDADLTLIDFPEAEIPKGANNLGKPKNIVSECIDRYEECKGWAENDECEQNPGWMIINCAESCNGHNNACDLRDPKIRCDRNRLGISDKPIYQPGDMEKMFQSIESRFLNRYNITVLSKAPWIVNFDGFLTNEEAKALVSHVDKWERSTDSGETNEFGETGRILSDGRTSSNAWCRESCEQDPLVQNIMSKIEEVTNVPRGHYESFQILRYEIGQKYEVHHDYGIEDIQLSCGPRILTFFLYLSDVEEGGETNFPSLGIAVKPKKGSAILWPSTLDSDPEAQETRTFHEAKPVIKGKKLAANSWIHLYDFNMSNIWGCTGTFDEF